VIVSLSYLVCNPRILLQIFHVTNMSTRHRNDVTKNVILGDMTILLDSHRQPCWSRQCNLMGQEEREHDNSDFNNINQLEQRL
jgi:hypothetical protein